MGVGSEKSGSEAIICPWCDYAHHELDEIEIPDGNASFVEVCRECDNPFEVTETAGGGYQTIKRDQEAK